MNPRRLVITTLLGLALALALAVPAIAKDYRVTDAETTLRLAPDGSLLVNERLTFDFDGHFEGAYRDIDLNRIHDDKITGMTVSEGGRVFQPGGNTGLGSHDRPGVFGTADFGDTYRVVWHYRATDEERTFELSYRVAGVVVAYDDVLDIGWAVWGDEWDFDLDHLTASFTNPALDPDDPLYRVWGHVVNVDAAERIDGETVRGAGMATLEADDVDSGAGVELRVTMPRDPAQNYPAARHEEGDGLPAILAFEEDLTEDFNSPWNRFKRFVAKHAFVAALGIAAIAWLLAGLLLWLTRERRTGTPEYLPEPPDDARPAVAYGLAHEGANSTNTVLATLLDLVDRGYYESSQATTEDEKLDLALKQKAERPADELTAYEQEVLAFFDQLLDGKQVAMSEMKDQVPKHSDVWRGRWERMTEALDDAETGELAWDRNLNWARWLIVLGAILAFGTVILIALAESKGWIGASIVAFVTVVGILALPATRLKRLDAERVDRTARWQAFERWTQDFPRLSDDPPATLELWKRILVYGVAFGTAERMIASGRIPAPVMEDATASGVWTGYAFTGGFHSDSFDAGGFSSAFASQVAPQSSSSGGGGGFSGGGGGFSGGGGGGAW